MGLWDLAVKILTWESSQDMVTLVLPGARFIKRREAQFQKQVLPARPFPLREIRSDGVLEVEIDGQRILIVVEVQSTKDEEMGERLLDYSYEAKRLHKLPVAAWVLHITSVFKPPKPPLEWPVPWVHRRFSMHDYQLEHSLMYKELIKEGREQGIVQGQEQNARQNIKAVVQARFPGLVELVQERMESVQTPEQLQLILVAMATAPSEEEARRYLLNWDKSE